MQSVILDTPILIVCYGIVLVLCLVDLLAKPAGYVLTVLSAVVFVATSAYALLIGVGLAELAVVAFILLALNLLSYTKKSGGGGKR